MFFRIGMQPVQPVIHLGAGVGFPSSYIIPAKPDVGNTSAPCQKTPTTHKHIKHKTYNIKIKINITPSIHRARQCESENNSLEY